MSGPPAPPRPANLRPLGWGWSAAAAFDGALAAAFGVVSGRAGEFGTLAWMLICALPVVLGIALAATSTADRQQYVARGLALALMAPIGLAMWAGTADDPAAAGAPMASALRLWLLGLGSLLAAILAWLALLAWAARRATRLDPAAGTPRVDLALLQQRLAALAASGAPLKLSRQDSRRSEFELTVDERGERGHQVVLEADAIHGHMWVRERLGAAGAAPLAHEASFHRPGDPLADAGRPPVQAVFNLKVQTTMLGPEHLGAWALRLHGTQVQGADVRPPGWDKLDAEDRGRLVVALLAALVLASGWSWRPRLPGPGGGPARAD